MDKLELEKVVDFVVWLHTNDYKMFGDLYKNSLEKGKDNFCQVVWEKYWLPAGKPMPNNIPEWAKETIRIYLEIE